MELKEAERIFKYSKKSSIDDITKRYKSLMNKYYSLINEDKMALKKINLIKDAKKLLIKYYFSNPKENLVNSSRYYKFESNDGINRTFFERKEINGKVVYENKSNNFLAIEDKKK